MIKQEEILSTIKILVQEEIPDAKVYLFGSRATGKIHEESDWDVLILTPFAVNRSVKNLLHTKLFPLSVEICSFINTIIASQHDWRTSPSYYCLRHSIKDEAIAL